MRLREAIARKKVARWQAIARQPINLDWARFHIRVVLANRNIALQQLRNGK